MLRDLHQLANIKNLPSYTEGFLRKYHDLFVNRDDVYAVQNADRTYTKIDQPLTYAVLREHLQGKITVGAYQLDKNNLVKWLVFDIDPGKYSNPKEPKETARKILNVVFEKKKELDGIERPRIWPHAVLFEASRFPDESYHIWIFFLLPTRARIAKWLALRILELANVSPKEVEVFPKQTELTEERPYGNCVKLPLGFHRVERKWSCFLDFETFQPLPNEILLEKSGISFTEADISKIMGFEEKDYVQIALDLPKTLKPLPDSEERRAVKFLVKYWKPGQRNRLEMAFLGWCLKRGISYESAYRIVRRVCTLTGDEETFACLQNVRYHYRNRASLGSALKGISGLKEIVEAELKWAKSTS